jgi:hypothetical protein
MILRNIYIHLQDYTASQPRGPQSQIITVYSKKNMSLANKLCEVKAVVFNIKVSDTLRYYCQGNRDIYLEM